MMQPIKSWCIEIVLWTPHFGLSCNRFMFFRPCPNVFADRWGPQCQLTDVLYAHRQRTKINWVRNHVKRVPKADSLHRVVLHKHLVLRVTLENIIMVNSVKYVLPGFMWNRISRQAAKHAQQDSSVIPVRPLKPNAAVLRTSVGPEQRAQRARVVEREVCHHIIVRDLSLIHI